VIAAGSPTPEVPERRATASERILDAVARLIVTVGVAAVSMQDVAHEAGVSKGLIHYHFRDKDTLLAQLIDWVTEGLVGREHSALAAVTPQTAVDALWRWLEGELERGHIRLLVELTQSSSAIVREASTRSAQRRREAATATIETVFGALALRPRIPAPLLAEVAVDFIDGLATRATLTLAAPPRAAFDVLWLSLLSLAE
jgi:AcrR family transcriptional regulator